MKPLPLILALVAGLALVFAAPRRAEEKITIAAASDLKPAMDELVAEFKKSCPQAGVDIVYGASGQLHAQIERGAPFDLYFSADIWMPRTLAASALAASGVKPYAIGRLVLWSASRDASAMTLADLCDPAIERIAIADPKDSPYGKRAEEALRAIGLWDKLAPKLVHGSDVAQAAADVQAGRADVGLIALSLALAAQGSYSLVDDKLHVPLKQAYIVTQRAAQNALARRFADFIDSEQARTILRQHGFALPGEAPQAG